MRTGEVVMLCPRCLRPPEPENLATGEPLERCPHMESVPFRFDPTNGTLVRTTADAPAMRSSAVPTPTEQAQLTLGGAT